jgi:hypothetical protein
LPGFEDFLTARLVEEGLSEEGARDLLRANIGHVEAALSRVLTSILEQVVSDTPF